MTTSSHTHTSGASPDHRSGQQGHSFRLRRSSGASRLSTSRIWACVWLGFSVLACAASLAWMLTTPSDQAMQEQIRHSPSVFPIPERLIIGGLGALFGLGCGIAGILFWPQGHRVRVSRPQTSLSTYDSVTGLPSQRLFLTLLNHALSRAAQTQRCVAVLMVELEEFRPLAASPVLPNATLVVRVQAARIKSALQSHDTVARIGEHTFAVMLDNLVSAEAALPVARAIQGSISLPLLIQGQELLLSCRLSGAVAPFDGMEGDALIEAASRLLSDSQTHDASIKFLSDLGSHPSPAHSAPRPQTATLIRSR